MSKVSHKYISVFIPVFNGANYLRECINMILAQQLPDGYELELLITDSGSRDGSIEILKSYGDKIKLNTIMNSEYSHGATRGKAAHMAKGEFMLYLSQDASPANDRWIVNMLEPFFISPKVGCVFGRQIPRPNAAATIKREVASVFGGLGASDSLVIHRSKSLVDGIATNPINTFFSDVNSAVRRDLLVGEVPFRNVNYAEDQALAKDMQKHGYLKAYTPLGIVWHSNEYTIREYYRRKFDEYVGLQESTLLQSSPSIRSLVLGWVRPTRADYAFIRHDREYSKKSKLLWYARSPFYNIAAQRGKYDAFKHYKNHSKRQKISLESQRRN